jgi:hypothetical protein
VASVLIEDHSSIGTTSSHNIVSRGTASTNIFEGLINASAVVVQSTIDYSRQSWSLTRPLARLDGMVDESVRDLGVHHPQTRRPVDRLQNSHHGYTDKGRV